MALARIFDCSADDILGIGTHKKEERIRYFKELAVKYDDPESEEYKSEMHNTPPDYREEMVQRLENAVFDFVRGTAEFEEILRMISV